MSQYDNKDTIVVFQNNKSQNPKAPKYTGKVVLSRESIEWLQGQIQAGVQEPELYVSMWERQSPRVQGVFYSGAVQPATPREGGSGRDNSYRSAPPRQQPVPPSNDLDGDDIPF